MNPAQMMASLRWKGKTPEQRKEIMKLVRKGRKKKATKKAKPVRTH